MPRSAFRLSWKLTGVFRIVAVLATPLMKLARRSPLALRNWRYRPQVSCRPTLMLCVPVTYDTDPAGREAIGIHALVAGAGVPLRALGAVVLVDHGVPLGRERRLRSPGW